MLTVHVAATSYFNQETCEFVDVADTDIVLEHSLISISKWESKWHKPFISSTLDDNKKDYEETLDYIRCMTLNKNVDPNIYYAITEKQVEEINQYISDPMTATWFSQQNEHGSSTGSAQAVTSELIYSWMIALGVPFECEKWHLNRLITLIRILESQQSSGKKMSRNDIYSQNKALNKIRRAKSHSRG